MVTLNLFKALQHLRLDTAPRVLWVDAICIDQDNIPERDAQVQLMGNIYRTAGRVIVWLGPEADNSAMLPPLVDSLVAWFDNDESEWSVIPKKPLGKMASHLRMTLFGKHYSRFFVGLGRTEFG